MEGDDIEFLKSELREFDHQIFKLSETNMALKELNDDDSESIIWENEEAIQIKKDKIWEIVKRFGSWHPDLPSTIPFTYNQIEEANGGVILSTERIIQILESEWKLK